MERPNPETIALYDRLVPEDPRVVRGQMFAHPCAFVGEHMFFGTFAQTLIARVGASRAAVLCEEGFALFQPMPGRPWREYVQFDPRHIDLDVARTLAFDALESTATLPPKAPKAPKDAAKVKGSGPAAGAKKAPRKA